MTMLDKQFCNSGEFDGKVAIVTGGARGIGKAFVRALASRGAAVGILGRTEATVKKLADELTAEGLRAIGIECDVADEVQFAAAVSAVTQAFGGVDILINNAGLHAEEYSDKGFGELGIAKSRRLLDVNVMGIVIGSLACQQSMASRGGGVILNISSISAYMSASAYGVSKLAANGLTMALATELAGDKIRVNGIAPGMTISDEFREELDPQWLDEFTQDFMKTKQLIQKISGPEDVVNAMLYLCSDWANFITGETIKVSGGYPLTV
jgi:NAD(P)-dependent dehydrogenase (short-subunit alcohol dehydrogenase family)